MVKKYLLDSLNDDDTIDNSSHAVDTDLDELEEELDELIDDDDDWDDDDDDELELVFDPNLIGDDFEE